MKNWQLFAIAGLMVLLLVGALLLFVLPERGTPVTLVTKTPNLTPQPTSTLAEIRVHLTGAVNSPGLLTLPKGARLADAIEAAGGLVEGFDENLLNLSDILIDGSKLHIPLIGEAVPTNVSPNRGGYGISYVESTLININTADFDTLCLLPGIGASKAQAIIAYREEHGLFLNLEDILKVKGIGPAIFNTIKDRITLEG